MRRRAALAALVAVALAPASRAADPFKRVGYLSGGAPPEELAKRLAELGWVQGRNLRFETRVAAPGAPPQVLATAVDELVRAQVDVLVAFLDRADALAAATKTIPIVAGYHPDPVGLGLVRSLRRPGGNVTGLSQGFRESASAWLGFLQAMRPQLARLVIVHGASGEARMRAVSKTWQEVGATMGIAFSYSPCATLADVSRAFDRLGEPQSGAALLVFGGMSTVALPESIMKDVLDLAIRRRIATMGPVREGALMSYDTSHSDPNWRMAVMIDKILRGEQAAEIPFELPDRTEFVLNRATARAIGVAVTPALLLRASEVID